MEMPKNYLAPKEWLDKMLAELDRLHELDRLAPAGVVTYFDIDLVNGIPPLYVTPPTLLVLAKAAGYAIRCKMYRHPDDYAVIHYFFYHGHKIYSAQFAKTLTEAQALCS